MSKPEFAISVVMPAWNAQETIARAIHSALDQEGVDLQLLVLDDGSTDNTASIVNSIKDDRLTYIKLINNNGPAAARNVGFRAATKDLIAVLDADDYYLPRRLRDLANLILESEADIVVDTCYCTIITPERKNFFLTRNNLMVTNIFHLSNIR
jgi:succinoglycan biosynthesis protein ExoO